MPKQALKKTKQIANPAERKLKELKKRKKLLLSRLQTQQIKLEALKDEVKTLTRTHPIACLHEMYEKQKSLLQEICDLIKQCLKSKNLNSSQKNDFKDLLKSVQAEMEYDEKEYSKFNEEQKEALNLSEEEILKQRAKMPSLEQALNALAPEASPEEKKNIRALYLELAKQCHPDKHKLSDQEKYHDLMQEINNAYHANDYNRLLQIKANIINYENSSLEETPEEKQKRETETLNLEIQLLESNLERLKTEINNIKKSEFGNALKSLNKMKKGMNAEFESGMEKLYFTKRSLEDFLVTGIFPEELFYEVEEFEEITEEDMLYALEMLMNMSKKMKKK